MGSRRHSTEVVSQGPCRMAHLHTPCGELLLKSHLSGCRPQGDRGRGWWFTNLLWPVGPVQASLVISESPVS